MSYTIIYGFDTNGNAYEEASVSNSWQGAMAIWNYFEETYLPPYIPEFIKHMPWYHPGMTYEDVCAKMSYKPNRVSGAFDGKENPMQEVWDLWQNPDIPTDERIVLMTTFDHVLVKREDLPRVINAFNTFKGKTANIEAQAMILETLYENDNCIAVGWNQTSINAKSWGTYYPGDDECTPYNCLNGADHWYLFDDLDNNEIA